MTTLRNIIVTTDTRVMDILRGIQGYEWYTVITPRRERSVMNGKGELPKSFRERKQQHLLCALFDGPLVGHFKKTACGFYVGWKLQLEPGEYVPADPRHPRCPDCEEAVI